MRRTLAAFVVVTAAIGLTMLPASLAPGAADAGPVVDQVEEDWEVAINAPDPSREGPQVTTTMSPVGTNRIPFVAFNLNYRDSPFQPGGLQVQLWNPTAVLDSDTQETGLLSTKGEVITWTQRMSINAGVLAYEIRHGRSQTWGHFGEDDNLSIRTPTSLADLSGYDPDVSASNSGAGWMGNRVTTMTLVQVRYSGNGQLIRTDATPRDCPLAP